jgi:hypothetical protein
MGNELGLLERDAELAAIGRLIEQACAGEGALLVAEGPAGAGKTGLVQAAIQAGHVRGMRVLAVSGSQLERELGFGMVRSLLESVLVHASPAWRESLLSGRRPWFGRKERTPVRQPSRLQWCTACSGLSRISLSAIR